MIGYEVFNLRQKKDETRAKLSFFGYPTGDYEIVRVPVYKNTVELYAAVAKFVDGVEKAGSEVLSISGSAWGESHTSYTDGDVVVWFREGGK